MHTMLINISMKFRFHSDKCDNLLLLNSFRVFVLVVVVAAAAAVVVWCFCLVLALSVSCFYGILAKGCMFIFT